jgi:hypothetical protein
LPRADHAQTELAPYAPSSTSKIIEYLVELPENVHLDQLHARDIDTSAGPMSFRTAYPIP